MFLSKRGARVRLRYLSNNHALRAPDDSWRLHRARSSRVHGYNYRLNRAAAE